MTAKPRDIEIVEVETPFRGYFRIDRYKLRHELFEGGMSGVMSREVFERGHAATILLYDPDREKLVFVEQFRIGAYAAARNSPWFAEDFSPWLIETVAGIIDAGETPEQVVRREAGEEADCLVLDVIPVMHYLVSPGGTTESLFVFVGRVDSTQAGGIFGLREEHENIRVLVAGVDEAFAWLDEGRIVNSMTLIPLMWFRHHRESVRRRFLEGVTPSA
ncbi:MAG: NUDIX domain-containing protein [Magnetospirillum sp. WYHS-4]